MTAVERDVAAPRWQLWVLLGIAALLLLSAFPYFEQTRNANEIPRLVQAIARVETGEWAIDGEAQRGIPLGPDVARSPVDGRLYPNKPPGASLIGTFAYRLARIGSEPPTLREFTWWARLLAGTLPALIVIGVAWGRLRELGHGAPVVGVTLMLWLFGTPMFAYARLFYGHALAACLLYVGLVLIARGQERRSLVQTGIGALAASSAIGVEYGVAFAGLPIGAALLLPTIRGPIAERLGAAKRAGLALVCALVPVVMLALYHDIAFGSPFATGYHHAADPAFAHAHGQGLLGLGWPRIDKVRIDLLSPKTGLLMFSPILAVAFAGLIHTARRAGPRASAARLDLAVFATLLVVGLGLGFEGGWRIGPRYLVAALPCLLLGLAGAIEAWRERLVFAGIWAGLATWSLLACGLAATLWPHVDPTNIGEPFGEIFLALLRDGRGPYGMPQWLGSAGTMICLGVPILLGLAATVWAFGPRTIQTLVPMTLGAAMGVLVLVVVIPRAVYAPIKSDRNLKYIEGVYEPRVWVEDGERIVEPAPSIAID